MHTERSVRDFCADLASGKPVPGGGAGAALTGALAAALSAMVCNFTIGRKRFQAVDAEMQALRSRADTIQAEMLDLVDDDARAYSEVVAAQQLPKETADESAERDRRLQTALAAAARVPLRAAVLAADVLALCEPIAQRGNPRLVSDAGVAALLADAALQAAALNVRVNIAHIRDPALVTELQAALAQLLSSAGQVKPRVMTAVQGKVA